MVGEEGLPPGHAGSSQYRPLGVPILHDGGVDALGGVFLHLGLQFRVLVGFLAQQPVVILNVLVVGICVGKASGVDVAARITARRFIALIVPDVRLERHEQGAGDLAGVVGDVAHHPFDVLFGDGVHLAQAGLSHRRLPQGVCVGPGGGAVGVGLQKALRAIAVGVAQIHAPELPPGRRGRAVGIGLPVGVKPCGPEVRVGHRRDPHTGGLRCHRRRGQEREHCQQSQKQCDDSLFHIASFIKIACIPETRKKPPAPRNSWSRGLNELYINTVSVHVTSPQPAPSSGIPAGRAHTYIMSANYLAWQLSRWYLSPGPFPQTRLRRSGCPASWSR